MKDALIPYSKYHTKIWYLDNCNEPISADHISVGSDELSIAKKFNVDGLLTVNKWGDNIWIPPHRIIRINFEKVK